MPNPSMSPPDSAIEPATVAPVGLSLLGLSLCTLLSSLGTSIANVGLPTLMEAFSVSLQQVQWVVIAYLLAVTTLIVGAGRLGDMVGRRKLLLAGIVLFTLASALCAAAPTLWLLIAARALQGIGAAMMMALSMAMVGEAVAKDRIGSAMGLLGTMSAIGTALGPSLGGVLISAFGWQAIFLVQVPLGLVAWALAYRALRPSAGLKAQSSFDLAGMLVLAVTLAAYALAMTFGRGSFGVANWLMLCAAAAGLAVFVWVETRASSPLLNLRLFRDLRLSAALIASLMVSAVLMTTLVVGPFYLARALGLDAARIGAVIAIGPVVVALSGVPAGRLADRFGADRITALGLSIVGTGALMFSLMPLASGIAGYICALVVTTAGYALFQTANNTSAMADVPADRRGVISAVLNLSRNIGLITGASVMGAIFAASAATGSGTAIAQAAATGIRTTFAVAVVMVAIALAITVGSQIAVARTRGGAA